MFSFRALLKMYLNCQHICITNLLVSYHFQQILKNSPKFLLRGEIKMDILTNQSKSHSLLSKNINAELTIKVMFTK